jgi:hypothetical protein
LFLQPGERVEVLRRWIVDTERAASARSPPAASWL